MMKTITPAVWLGLCLLRCAPALAADYDPLVVSATAQQKAVELIVDDSSRRREIPIKVYLPSETKPAPVLLYSHGLGGTRQICAFLGQHWSARGYVVVCLQHPGSDAAVWMDAQPGERMAAMRRAASVQNFLLRVRDVPVVLDRLEKWNRQQGHSLSDRLDLTRVGMSGHSFGAITTQAVSGESYFIGGQPFTDPRIKAALAFSPSSPLIGDPAQSFAGVKIPWMLMTGTKDTVPLAGQTPESRLAVYPRLPTTIDKYELVLHNAEHSAFTDRVLPGDREPRNPNHHRAILALSTAFWDAHLLKDAAARAWLHGAQSRALLDPQDRWQLSPAASR